MPHLAMAPDHWLRFSSLKNSIEETTQRMLTLTRGTWNATGSSCVIMSEYELTEMGAGMLPALEGFTSWIRDNWPRIEQCRRAYD